MKSIEEITTLMDKGNIQFSILAQNDLLENLDISNQSPAIINENTVYDIILEKLKVLDDEIVSERKDYGKTEEDEEALQAVKNEIEELKSKVTNNQKDQQDTIQELQKSIDSLMHDRAECQFKLSDQQSLFNFPLTLEQIETICYFWPSFRR